MDGATGADVGAGTPPPPPGVDVRRAGWDDLDAVVALYNACSLDRVGEAIWERDDLHHRWLEPDRFADTLVAERHGGLVADGGAELVGYAEFSADVDPWTGEVDLYLDARVHPAATGSGIGTFFLRRSVARALAAAAGVPGEHRVALRTSLPDADDRGRALFQRFGFRPVRHFLDMRLDLDDPPPPPEVRSSVRIRRFVLGVDDEAVWRAYEAGFADHWAHEPQSFEDWRYIAIEHEEHVDPTLWFLAETQEGGIVGVCLTRAGMRDDPEMAYIRDLAVVPAWRRRGIATRLLRTAFAEFHARGLRRVGLEVDDVTLDGAAQLYQRAGMRIARRTDVYELELRPEGSPGPG
ncbi:MAG: GNAT family N-acetyltransferase [Actinobacteria bacterium]|nr:GNAT family N-acetyltransferase [Actinomycetota bacterium]